MPVARSLPFILLLAACAGSSQAMPSPEAAPSPAPTPQEVAPDPLAKLPVRLYIPSGWFAIPAESSGEDVLALMQDTATGTIITIVQVRRHEGVETDAIATAFFLAMLQDGFTPTSAPKYDQRAGVSFILFAGTVSDGTAVEGEILVRESVERPDMMLLFLAEWPPGYMAVMLPQIETISIGTRFH